MRRPFHEFDESIAAGKWQRLQQDRVDDAVDRGRCTNADRESEDGGNRETRTARERTDRVRDIACHNYDSSSSLSTRPERRRHFSVSLSSAFSPLFVIA